MTTIDVLNGPNLNLLGTREPQVHGTDTLGGIERAMRERPRRAGIDIVKLQSNPEGDLIDWIHEAGAAGAPIILNAGACTPTSVALRDAVKGAGASAVEVHLSNSRRREPFRHQSSLSPVAKGIIMGFGARSHDLALEALPPRPAPDQSSDP